jgi:hypothetical protein
MSNYTELIENLNEFKYNQFRRKQKSITSLFPKFYDRVAKVEQAGGMRLVNQFPDLWQFKVHSGTKQGVRYDVYLRFKNLEEILPKYISDQNLWNKEKTDIDYKKVAAEILNNLDLDSDCSCQADSYYGGEYIKTQRQAQYGDQENRPPRIKNPRQYGILCKHGEFVFEALPMYTTTFATFLKRFWKKEIDGIVQEIIGREEMEIKPEIPKELQKEVGKAKQFIQRGEEPETLAKAKREIGKMVQPEKPGKPIVFKEKPKTPGELAKSKKEKEEIQKLEDELRRTSSPAIQRELQKKLQRYFEVKPQTK